MRYPTFIHFTSAALLSFTFAMGCGTNGNSGTGQDNTTVGQSTGYMMIHTLDNTSRDYKEVNVAVKAIAVLDVDGIWHDIPCNGKIINLLNLDIEARALIDARVDLKIGKYTKLRLTLGDGCNVVTLDGQLHELRIPVELQAGLLIDIDLDVRANLDIDLFLDFDLAGCLQLVVDAGKPCYYLRPFVKAVDRVLTGEISGILRGVTGEILADVDVYAEIFDEFGRPHIVRRCKTDAQGHYKLDFLPLGKKYHVVCFPAKFGKQFKAFASAEISIDADVSIRALDINLDVDLSLNLAALGNIQGKVSPVITLDGSDKVDLVTQLSCGTGCSKWFVVADATAKVDVDESYLFGSLCTGTYAVQSSRGKCQTGGICTWAPLWVSANVNLDLSLNLSVFLGINL